MSIANLIISWVSVTQDMLPNMPNYLEGSSSNAVKRKYWEPSTSIPRKRQYSLTWSPLYPVGSLAKRPRSPEKETRRIKRRQRRKTQWKGR